MNLTSSEQLALSLLQSNPGEIRKVVRQNGTINIDDLFLYYAKLTRELNYARSKRRNEYIDIKKLSEGEAEPSIITDNTQAIESMTNTEEDK